jgi:hypothetical protein
MRTAFMLSLPNIGHAWPSGALRFSWSTALGFADPTWVCLAFAPVGVPARLEAGEFTCLFSSTKDLSFRPTGTVTRTGSRSGGSSRRVTV